MQMRRVGAGGTTSSPKHDKYLIRRNGNCQARLIVSHIIWREVANLDIAFDLSLSRSCLSLSAGTYAHLPSRFLPPVAMCSSSLCSSRTSRKPQFKLSCGITRTREVVSLKSPFPVYLCLVSHTTLYSDLFFPLCVVHCILCNFVFSCLRKYEPHRGCLASLLCF